MAITRQKKEEVVKDLTNALDDAKVVIFTDFKGMDVNSLTELRSKIKQGGGRYLVAKKTLLKKAIEDKKIKDLDPLEMEGQIGIAFGMEDMVSTSKAVYDAQKETKTLKIISGIMDGKVIAENDVVTLANLPTREELVGKFVGTVKAPLSGFVNVLRGNVTGLVYALNAIKEQK